MKKIIVNKIIGYKRWIPIEVIEGSDKHMELIRWNRAVNFQNKQDKKEMEAQNERAENEISIEKLQEESQFELVDEDEPSPEEWYIQTERNNEIWNALEELPENQREIIFLFFYQGYSLRDIARYKGKNSFTIRKSFHSALEKLRKNEKLKKFFENFS